MYESSSINQHDVLVLILSVILVLVSILTTVLKSMIFQYEL